MAGAGTANTWVSDARCPLPVPDRGSVRKACHPETGTRALPGLSARGVRHPSAVSGTRPGPRYTAGAAFGDPIPASVVRAAGHAKVSASQSRWPGDAVANPVTLLAPSAFS